MNEQPEKTYRQIIEEGDAQREIHRKQAEQDFNDPVFLREALEMENQDRRRLKRELAAATAEIARLQKIVNMVLGVSPLTEPELGSARVNYADQENYKAAYNLWLIGNEARKSPADQS